MMRQRRRIKACKQAARLLLLPWLIATFSLVTTVFAQGDIGPEAVWEPSDEAVGEIERCLDEAQNTSCLLIGMQADNASPQAIAVAEAVGGDGHLVEFEEMGVVDRGMVRFPFRANDNFQPVLLNGSPPLVEVDGAVEGNVRTSPHYVSLATRYRNMIMWYGDNSFGGMEARQGRRQRFIFSFNLVDGCHACDVLGQARVAFDFDETGHFLGTSFLPPEEQAGPAAEVPEGLISYLGHDGNVWLVNSDGTGQQQITDDANIDMSVADFVMYCCLSWSPDGLMLAYERLTVVQAEPREHVFVYSLIDGSTRELIEETAINGFDWSPDGSAIVYGRAIPEEFWNSETRESVTVKGLWQVDVTTGMTSEIVPPERGYPLSTPKWSADGRYLAFVEIENYEGEQPFAIYDFDSEQYISWGEAVGNWAWEPGGDSLVYDGLTRADPLGQNRTRLTSVEPPLVDVAPLVSPTGEDMAFRRESAEAGAPGLWVVRGDGSGERQLGSFIMYPEFGGPVAYFGYSWAPDGEWLTVVNGLPFGLSPSPTAEILLVNQQTRESHFLANGSWAVWQPNTSTTVSETIDPGTWLETKRDLIRKLQAMNIPTSLFTVPIGTAYDESAATVLLAQVQEEYEQGNLTDEQIEAFIRLTLQESALEAMLPAYTEVAATISNTSVDTLETIVGTIFLLRPGWERCQMLLCDRLQQLTERHLWRLASDFGRTAIRYLGSTPEQRETGARFWELAVDLVEVAFEEGRSLEDLLTDSAIEASITYLLVAESYLPAMQPLLNDGVTTADLSRTGEKPWPIRGEQWRAEMLVDHYLEQAAIQSQSSLDRHRDFQQAADLVRLAEDIADIAATTSPASFVAGAVSLGSRLEHLILVNAPLIYLNFRDLNCVTYLSGEVARAVFVADEPFGTCLDREASMPGWASSRSKPANQDAGRMQVEITKAAEEYRTAVNVLVNTVDTNDMAQVEAALNQLEQADIALTSRLDEVSALVLAQNPVSESGEAFITANRVWTIRNASLYLAITSLLLSQEEGVAAEVDLEAVVGATLAQLDTLEHASTVVQPVAPVGPVLVIRGIEFDRAADDSLELNVTIANVGADAAQSVRVLALAGDEQPVVESAVGILPAGEEATVALALGRSQMDSALAIQVWRQDEIMDAMWTSLAVPVTETVGATPEAEVGLLAQPTDETLGEDTESTALPTPPKSEVGATGPNVLLNWLREGNAQSVVILLLGVLALSTGGVWLWRRRTRG